MQTRWSRSRTAVAVALTAALTVAAGACKEEFAPRRDGSEVTRSTGELGVPVDYYGVSAAAASIVVESQSKEAFPRFRVTMRSESSLGTPWQNPDVQVRCAESEMGGEWYRGSTWESNGILPGGQVNEGQIIVGFPSKPGASRYPVPTCTDARIEVTGTNPLDRAQTIVTSYPLTPEMVSDAINAPRS